MRRGLRQVLWGPKRPHDTLIRLIDRKFIAHEKRFKASHTLDQISFDHLHLGANSVS